MPVPFEYRALPRQDAPVGVFSLDNLMLTDVDYRLKHKAAVLQLPDTSDATLATVVNNLHIGEQDRGNVRIVRPNGTKARNGVSTDITWECAHGKEHKAQNKCKAEEGPDLGFFATAFAVGDVVWHFSQDVVCRAVVKRVVDTAQPPSYEVQLEHNDGIIIAAHAHMRLRAQLRCKAAAASTPGAGAATETPGGGASETNAAAGSAAVAPDVSDMPAQASRPAQATAQTAQQSEDPQRVGKKKGNKGGKAKAAAEAKQSKGSSKAKPKQGADGAVVSKAEGASKSTTSKGSGSKPAGCKPGKRREKIRHGESAKRSCLYKLRLKQWVDAPALLYVQVIQSEHKDADGKDVHNASSRFLSDACRDRVYDQIAEGMLNEQILKSAQLFVHHVLAVPASSCMCC